ncbi:unnamed protein product [Rotaria socialis]|uniref:EGF-like domain-containing protein n=2 Tax=Rotaria socialis TaxID=392032 RepID=A0A820UC74_9BILA|nr:unnamed protein product [Rotaria socialis]
MVQQFSHEQFGQSNSAPSGIADSTISTKQLTTRQISVDVNSIRNVANRRPGHQQQQQQRRLLHQRRRQLPLQRQQQQLPPQHRQLAPPQQRQLAPQQQQLAPQQQLPQRQVPQRQLQQQQPQPQQQVPQRQVPQRQLQQQQPQQQQQLPQRQVPQRQPPRQQKQQRRQQQQQRRRQPHQQQQQPHVFICSPACMNGGNCTATNACTCNTAMWGGPICQTPNRIFWSFDNTLQDLYNNFNGVGNNGPTYSSPGYNGAGACILLTQSSSQSVTIASPFLNFAGTSFTLEVWIYANTLYNSNPYTDNAVFGQFDQNVLDKSLHIIIRNQRIYLGFFSDDVVGTQLLSAGQWYHMAYIYDYSVRTQYVYVNGYLDASRTSAGPYQGTTGSLTIGTNGVNTPNNFFDGYLDSIAYFGSARNASQVLDDATLVSDLTFDGNSLVDSGPLLINGTGTSYSYTTSGRVNGAVTLSVNPSYVQITGLRRLGLNAWPYSVAIWIKPTSVAGGTIMHLSSLTNGAQPNGWCLPIMGLTSAGRIAINSWNGGNMPVTGSSVPLNTWTHVVGTYSSINGLRLYVNGVLSGSSGAYSFAAGGVPMTITLGSSLLGLGVCNTGTIQMGQFYGSLDEFRVYARELTVAEVVGLANP